MKFDNLNLGTNDVTLTTPERDLNATGRFLDDVEDLGVLGGAATGFTASLTSCRLTSCRMRKTTSGSVVLGL